MSVFSGNLSIRVSIELRSVSLIFPWIRKASTIICFRAYQSSGPVSYTPRNYSIDKEKQKSPLTKSFEEKSIDCSLDSSSSRNTRSYNKTVTQRLLNLDDGSHHQFLDTRIIPEAETMNLTNTFGSMMALPELEDNTSDELEVMDDHLEKVSETDNFEFKLSDDNSVPEMDTARTGKTKQDAENLAIKVLARRAFTAVELRKKLHGRKFPHDVIDAVIADFQERGLLNDYLYAESFSQSRWHSLSWGPRRIKQALLHKGVSEADAEKATKHVFEDDGSDSNQDINLGMSKLSMDHLFAQALKQWLRGQDVPPETQKARIVRWLQYRGFSWGVTSFILRKLEAQYPP